MYSLTKAMAKRKPQAPMPKIDDSFLRSCVYSNIGNDHEAIYNRRDPKIESGDNRPITLTLSYAEWISIRAALITAADDESDMADRVKDCMLKSSCRRSENELRSLSQKIDTAMSRY